MKDEPGSKAADAHGQSDEDEAVLKDDLLLVSSTGKQREHAGSNHDANLEIDKDSLLLKEH